jgi:hypothetical protein
LNLHCVAFLTVDVVGRAPSQDPIGSTHAFGLCFLMAQKTVASSIDAASSCESQALLSSLFTKVLSLRNRYGALVCALLWQA